MTDAKTLLEGTTPGPWEVRSIALRFEVVGEYGLVKVVSTSWHDRVRKPYPLKAEACANAKLAAAAPDLARQVITLREGLERLRDQMKLALRSNPICDEEETGDWLGQIEACLAEARS